MITSTANPRIKAARKLTSRKQRYAAGQFLVEGVRLVRDALQSGARPEAVFFDREALAGTRDGLSVLDALTEAGCETVACAPSVFATLAETVSPQGITAVFRFPNMPAPPEPTLVLVLDGVRDPGNAGTLLRSAEAAGADFVIFGPDSVDPYNEKVVRAGMGTHFRLPLAICSSWGRVREVLGAELTVYLADTHSSLAYDQVDWCEASALVVGGEAHGPSDAARAMGSAVAIPMLGKVESLNAAVAASAILFEAARQRRTQSTCHSS